MNPFVAQYTPFFLAVIAVGLGVIYSNSRITDIKDLIRAESNATRAELARVEATLRSEIARVKLTLRADINRLEQRMDRLEVRMDHLEQRMDRFERVIRS